MVWHQMSFQQLNISLSAQFSKNISNFSSKFSIQFFLPVFWDKYNVVFAIPPDMR